MMKILTVILIIILFILGVLLMLGYSAFGTKPGVEYQTLFEASSQYDPKREIFVNRRGDFLKEMRQRSMNFSTFKDFFGKGKDRSPLKTSP